MIFFSSTSNLCVYDLAYLTLLQRARPSIPSDDRLLRSCWCWCLSKHEIKMIYHPRIAGAPSMEKIGGWLYHAALRSCQACTGLPPHSSPSCGSTAIVWVIPWQRALPSLGWPSNWLPGCTTPLGWGWVLSTGNGGGGGSRLQGWCSCSEFLVLSFPHFSSHLTFPSVCLLYVCHSISTSLFLSVSLSLPPCLPAPHFVSLIPACCVHPPLTCSSQRTSWPCPYQSVAFPCGSWDEKNALCALEHPLWHY